MHPRSWVALGHRDAEAQLCTRKDSRRTSRGVRSASLLKQKLSKLTPKKGLAKLSTWIARVLARPRPGAATPVLSQSTKRRPISTLRSLLSIGRTRRRTFSQRRCRTRGIRAEGDSLSSRQTLERKHRIRLLIQRPNGLRSNSKDSRIR